MPEKIIILIQNRKVVWKRSSLPVCRTSVLALVEVPFHVPPATEGFTARRTTVSAAMDVTVMLKGTCKTKTWHATFFRFRLCHFAILRSVYSDHLNTGLSSVRYSNGYCTQFNKPNEFREDCLEELSEAEMHCTAPRKLAYSSTATKTFLLDKTR